MSIPNQRNRKTLRRVDIGVPKLALITGPLFVNVFVYPTIDADDFTHTVANGNVAAI